MMTSAEQQHAQPCDLDLWHEMVEAMETREQAEEPLDSDQARAQALNQRVKEGAAATNAAYYSGEGDCEW